MSYDPYIPLTADDLVEYISMCRKIDAPATRAGWVATLTQNMNNNDTNRTYDDACRLWPGEWPGKLT